MIKQTTLTLTDFQDTTVKGAYDTVPEINYPLITILEIQNTENSKFTDQIYEGSNLAILIDFYQIF